MYLESLQLERIFHLELIETNQKKDIKVYHFDYINSISINRNQSNITPDTEIIINRGNNIKILLSNASIKVMNSGIIITGRDIEIETKEYITKKK